MTSIATVGLSTHMSVLSDEHQLLLKAGQAHVLFTDTGTSYEDMA